MSLVYYVHVEASVAKQMHNQIGQFHSTLLLVVVVVVVVVVVAVGLSFVMVANLPFRLVVLFLNEAQIHRSLIQSDSV